MPQVKEDIAASKEAANLAYAALLQDLKTTHELLDYVLKKGNGCPDLVKHVETVVSACRKRRAQTSTLVKDRKQRTELIATSWRAARTIDLRSYENQLQFVPHIVNVVRCIGRCPHRRSTKHQHCLVRRECNKTIAVCIAALPRRFRCRAADTNCRSTYLK